MEGQNINLINLLKSRISTAFDDFEGKSQIDCKEIRADKLVHGINNQFVVFGS